MGIFLSIVGGLFLLVVGGELLVRGAVSIARLLAVSPLLIGLVLVGFGTSTPELVTSLMAAFGGSPGIAVGNVVGSNICNILLILGLATLIRGVPVAREGFGRDSLVLGLASLAMTGVVLSGHAGRFVGLAFLLGLVIYVFMVYRQEKKTPHAGSEETSGSIADPASPGKYLRAFGLCLVGLALTFGGAHVLVDGSIGLARSLGVSDTIIGLTIVAVGTSMPEMVASVMAAIRGQSGIAYGNIIGSNIYNILGIIGLTAFIHPIDVPPQIASFDVWVMLGTALLMIVFSFSHRLISRAEGVGMLALYMAYTAWLIHIA
ncbi:MAG TPA: calcium/sodium antiporter [Alphaproteobacteria bacterium]|nr:calcium/sodium antiporter [Alphaproteobacteria bacterium]